MIKKVTLLMMVFSCLSLAFISNSNVYAVPIALSEASIDWSTFTYSGIDINWSDKGSDSEAYAEDDNNYVDNDDWTDDWGTTSAVAPVTYARGEGWTTADVVAERTWARWNGYSDAFAERYGSFEALEDGTLTISVAYSLSQDLSTDNDDEYAYGFSSVELDLDSYFDDAILENEAWDGSVFAGSDRGTLQVSAEFNKGDFGAFIAWVENESEVWSDNPDSPVVPEPATFLLLLSGLLGLLGTGFIKRKR